MKKKEILVTGANGFIGRSLIPVLLRKGYRVHVITRGTKKEWGTDVRYHKADLQRGLSPAIIKNIDAVVHLASEIDINGSIREPKTRLLDNLTITLSVLEAVRESGRTPLMIYTSTDRVYGKTTKKTALENDVVFPIEPYTASKIMGETVLATYANLYDIPYIVLRLDSVYGPGQPRSMFISDMITKSLSQSHLDTGPLGTKKNFVYVGDVVDAILLGLRAKPTAYNEAYNIGGSHASLRDVLRVIRRIFEEERSKRITVSEGKVSARPSKAEVNPFVLSTKKAERFLGWRAKTELYKGLKKTIEYFAT